MQRTQGISGGKCLEAHVEDTGQNLHPLMSLLNVPLMGFLSLKGKKTPQVQSWNMCRRLQTSAMTQECKSKQNLAQKSSHTVGFVFVHLSSKDGNDASFPLAKMTVGPISLCHIIASSNSFPKVTVRLPKEYLNHSI